MHQTASPVPVVGRQRLRQYRNKPEIVVLPLPAIRKIRHIKVGFGAVTPVERHFTGTAPAIDVKDMLKDAFDWRETGATGDEYNGFIGVFAKKKCAERTLE